MASRLVCVSLGLLFAACASGQELEIVLPKGHKATDWLPAVVTFWSGEHEAESALRDTFVGSGIAAVVVNGVPEEKAFAAMLFDLRQRVRIAQGGLHALIASDAEPALAAVLAQRHEFQTITVCGAAASADLTAVKKLRGRRVYALATTDAAKLCDHVRKLHKAREMVGAAGDVSRTLDSFHDAAAVGDEERYFQILPNDSVFLGTDATERWTGKEFRSFAMRYFKRKSAWTYVPFERHVTLSKNGDMAWFDEALDNAGYGECRGTGVMVKRADRWVVLQYNLTVPIPNDLMSGVAKQIRAHLDGE